MSLQNLLAPMIASGLFMPHGHCYFWDSELMALHAISDALIVLSYYSIPGTLLYFVRRRKDLQFHWMFVCFAMFILACGTSHLLEIWNIWHGDYWVAGAVKGVTALASVPTAILLMKLVPHALALPSQKQLLAARDELGVKVAERTAELSRRTDELHASEERLRLIIETALDAVVVMDSTSRITGWNPQAEKIFGWKREEVMGRLLTETMIPERYREAHLRGLKHYLQSGEGPALNRRLEFEALHRDGHEFPVEISITPIRIRDSVTFSAFLRDLTEAKRVEAALREKEAQLHATDRRLAEIVHGMTEACFALDREWRFTFVNDRGEALLRQARADMVGRSIWEVFHQLAGTPMEHNYRRAMAERVPLTFEMFSPIAERWLDIRLFPTAEGLAAFLLDIDARKQAEEALKLSEESFRTMADSMAQLAWIAEADGFIFWYNRRWYEYTGTTPAQMEGWGWQSVHDPEVLPEVMEKWTAAIQSGQPFDMEFPLRGADGEFRAFLTRGQPVKDAGGRVKLWFGTNTDVETLKRAREALQQSERKLREVIDGLGPNTFLGLMTPDGTLIEANRPGLVAAGIRSEDALGKPFDQTFWWGHSEPVRRQLREAMARAAKGEGSRYDVQVRVAGDALLWIDFSLNPVSDASGRVIYLVPSGIVIEERVRAEAAIRESEEHFRFLNDLSDATRSLAEPAQLMAVTARMLGGYLQASRCAYADVEKDGEQFTILHDYTDGCASTVGQYQLSLFGPRAVATLKRGETLIIRHVDKELSPGEGAEMFNAIGIRAIICCPLVKDGHLRAMMAVHQTTPRDWRPREIAIVQDVVERCWATIQQRTAEEEIQKLNARLEDRVAERTAQLEAANKELEAFSYSVSHDLRAPLRAVDGFSRAVVEDFGAQLPEEGQRYLRTIRESAQRMGTLIDDLLTFSRLSRLPLTRQTVDTRGQVRATLDELLAAHRGRVIDVQLGELPPCEGDPALLRQVWVNLLSNAFKYTAKREVAVVEIGTLQKDGSTAYFVRDNGTGFDMRYANKLFGVFQRLHRQEEFEGTGVGLAIVQRIVHRHGGLVWAEAAVDQGATFCFTLKGAPRR